MLNVRPETEDGPSQDLPKTPEEIPLEDPLPRPQCRDGSSLSSYDYDDEDVQTSTAAADSLESRCMDESSSCESEEEEESSNDALATIPEQLAAHAPQVMVENSSEVYVGPQFKYNGPITVKQYITVNGRGEPEAQNSAIEPPPHLKGLSHILFNPNGNKVGADNDTFTSSEDNLNNGIPASQDALFETKRNNIFVKKHLIWIGSLLVILVVVAISLAVTLQRPDSSSSSPSPQDSSSDDIKLSCKNKDITAVVGRKSVQWVVDVESSIGEVEATWYDPKCREIKTTDPGYETYTVDKLNGKTQALLTVLDIDKLDRGLYKLRVHNDKGERWEYFTLQVDGNGPTDRIVACYVASWSHLRTGRGRFDIEDIDPGQCTHLIYAFANLDTTTSTIHSADPSYDLGDSNGNVTGAYKRMTSLREKYPYLKVLLSVGGWAERLNKNYSIIAESPQKCKDLASSIVGFLRKHDFDGLDFHWQYPAEQHGTPADKENFVYLLKELKEAFERENTKWLLTAPLGVMPDTIERSYNIPEISKHLDYMFALCYAYHGFWDYQTGPNAPLYARQAGDKRNVYVSLTTLVRMGAPPNKLVLGLPIYGRNFILQREYDGEGFGAPTVGEGFIGDYVQEQGTWGYNEICFVLGKKDSLWEIYWENVTHTPFMVDKKRFMSYDNERSLSEKAYLARTMNLAGVVAYSLDTDDFRGDCAFDKTGVTNYPLVRAINKALALGPKEPCKI